MRIAGSCFGEAILYKGLTQIRQSIWLQNLR